MKTTAHISVPVDSSQGIGTIHHSYFYIDIYIAKSI